MEAFLQLGSVTAGAAEMAGMRAFAALRTAAGRSHSLRVASLAAEVRTAKVGHFDKVIAAIDQMIQVLKDEEAGDIANRDQCKDEYQKIESKVKDLNWKIEKNEAKIDKLEKLIELRTAEKFKTVEDIESTQKAIVQMEDQRQEENQAFLEAKSDDEGAIELLEKAKAALAAYYEKNKIELGPIQGSVKGALLQEPVFQVSEDQAPDATFSHMGLRKGDSKGILSIITMVIEDLQDEIKTGIKDEEKAQLDFEAQLAAAKQLKKELEEKKVTLEETIAKRESEKDDEHADMQVNLKDKADELAWKKEIKADCDFAIRSFEGRRERRKAEMEGLVAAKEYLAGATPPAAAMLQRPPAFDDTRFQKINFLGMSRA